MLSRIHSAPRNTQDSFAATACRASFYVFSGTPESGSISVAHLPLDLPQNIAHKKHTSFLEIIQVES